MQNLTSQQFVEEVRAKIENHFASDDNTFFESVKSEIEDNAVTSHVSVLDRDGLAVSVTSSIGHV